MYSCNPEASGQNLVGIDFKHEFHEFPQISIVSLVCEIDFTN